VKGNVKQFLSSVYFLGIAVNVVRESYRRGPTFSKEASTWNTLLSTVNIYTYYIVCVPLRVNTEDICRSVRKVRLGRTMRWNRA